MTDWAVGDLGITTDDECADCGGDGGEGYLAAGIVCSVIGVDYRPEWLHPALHLAGHPHPAGWCACSFRKIRPDEQEACEEEFVTLLKRSKQRVEA